MAKRPITTCVDFGIRPATMRAEEITRLLGIQPTSAWNKGDRCLSKELHEGHVRDVERSRPWCVWHYDSADFCQSDSIEVHLNHVLEVLEPAANRIVDLINRDEAFVIVRIWFVGVDGFDLPAKLAARIARLCHTITVTGWTPAELAAR